MRAELCVTVDRALTVEQGHDIAKEVHHELLDHLPYLSSATIHVDPANASGDEQHHVHAH
jgi:divalent metal cation (Fe/Co/Zn/Cd) transporter